MTILVTGGAGYIGGHTVLALLDQGSSVIILDDLSTGFTAFVPDNVPLVVGDVGDQKLVADIIRKNNIKTIFHFAGKIIVSESISDPLSYYLSNTIKAHSLIQAAVENGVENFIFSSTAAVYGQSESSYVNESAPLDPISPYGMSKLMTEKILHDVSAAHGLNYAILRYFNVAGADPQMRNGQATRKATHLIRLALAVVLGERDFIEIYGDDYPTKDGTCIRDFIHVSDLARAHLAALNHLKTRRTSVILNCGYGRGYSVKEVLKIVEKVTGKHMEKRIGERRNGDPIALVSDNQRLLTMGWIPQFDNLSTIIEHAYKWEIRLRDNAV
jgi:UDP-glucose 4-epimerase